MMMGAGMIGMIAFWALLIWGAVHVASHAQSLGGSRRDDSPLDILEQRFARGEIDREDYETRRRALQDR